MKKAFIFALIISLFLASCKDDSPVLKDKDIKSMLPGVWRAEAVNGETILTDKTLLLDFGKDGRLKYAFTDVRHTPDAWLCSDSMAYSVKHAQLMLERGYEIQYLIGHCDILRMTPYRMVMESGNNQVELIRILNDYSEPILGLWSGVTAVENSFSDFDHFWSYLPSGNYGYFKKNDRGVWYKSHDVKSDYQVFGDVLFTHWTTASGEDHVENWIVDGIMNGYMKWGALREGNVREELIMERIVNDPKEGIVPLVTNCRWVLDVIRLDGVPKTAEEISREFGLIGVDSTRSFGRIMVFNADMTMDVTYKDAVETLLYVVRDDMIYTDTMSGLPLVMNFNPISNTIVGEISFGGREIQVVYKKSV